MNKKKKIGVIGAMEEEGESGETDQSFHGLLFRHHEWS